MIKEHIKSIKKIVTELVTRIIDLTEYNSCCIDIMVPKEMYIGDFSGSLIVVEINCPAWLFATSGLFVLESGRDEGILFGEYFPDIIDYPVLKVRASVKDTFVF